MSGQAALLSHAILVGFSLFLIYSVFTTFNGLKEDYQQNIGGLETDELCFVMRGAIEKVYAPFDINITTNTSMGSVQVLLPDRITDLKYAASFFNRSIKIVSTKFNSTCKIGFNTNYNGSTSGGLTRFSYMRYTNGTNVIEMVKA